MKFIVALFVLEGIIGSNVNAEVDCQKHPQFMNVKKCCKIPQPNWSKYSDACNRYNLASQRSPSPCFIECVFNQSQILNGDQLNMDNVGSMLANVFQDNTDFIPAFTVAFQKCGPVVSQHLSAMKGKQKGFMPKGFDGQSCSLTGVGYAMCAYKNVFATCPQSAWTSTTDCEYAKEYASTCEPKFGGSGGGKRRLRRQTEEEVSNPSQTDGNLPNNGKRRKGERIQGGAGGGQGGRQGAGGQRQGPGQGQGRGQRQGQGRAQGLGKQHEQAQGLQRDLEEQQGLEQVWGLE